MSTKRYNERHFTAKLANGRTYHFYCYRTNTRMGFCHTCATEVYAPEGAGGIPGVRYCSAGGGWGTFRDTKCSYSNRTWERFTFETALRYAIGKCPKSDRAELTRLVIDKENEEASRRCDRMLGAFMAAYNTLSDKRKAELAENPPMLHTQEEAKAMTLAMRMTSLIDATA